MEIVDNINHPKHYEDAGYFVQPIDAAQELPFCLGNAVKYLCRVGRKEGSSEIEDLEKARWYMQRQLALWDQEEKREGSDPCAVLSEFGSCALGILHSKEAYRPVFMGMFTRWPESGKYYCDTSTLGYACGVIRDVIGALKEKNK